METVLAGLALGLAAGTKLTFLYALPALVAIGLLALPRRRLAELCCAAVAGFVLLGSFGYIQNTSRQAVRRARRSQVSELPPDVTFPGTVSSIARTGYRLVDLSGFRPPGGLDVAHRRRGEADVPLPAHLAEPGRVDDEGNLRVHLRAEHRCERGLLGVRPARLPPARAALARLSHRMGAAPDRPRARRACACAAAVRRRARARHALEPLRRPLPDHPGGVDAAACAGRPTARAGPGRRRSWSRPRRSRSRSRTTGRSREASGTSAGPTRRPFGGPSCGRCSRRCRRACRRARGSASTSRRSTGSTRGGGRGSSGGSSGCRSSRRPGSTGCCSARSVSARPPGHWCAQRFPSVRWTLLHRC